jgi:hypothetical protein
MEQASAERAKRLNGSWMKDEEKRNGCNLRCYWAGARFLSTIR